MTADTLNRLCAEHVAHWKPFAHPLMKYHNGDPVMIDTPPDYVNDPAAVLALLEKEGMVEINKMHRMNVGWQWEVKVWEDGKGYFPKGEAEAPTFAEAAVRALLRARGIEVQG